MDRIFFQNTSMDINISGKSTTRVVPLNTHKNLWFQHDRALPDLTAATRGFLKTKFGQK